MDMPRFGIGMHSDAQNKFPTLSCCCCCLVMYYICFTQYTVYVAIGCYCPLVRLFFVRVQPVVVKKLHMPTYLRSYTVISHLLLMLTVITKMLVRLVVFSLLNLYVSSCAVSTSPTVFAYSCVRMITARYDDYSLRCSPCSGGHQLPRQLATAHTIPPANNSIDCTCCL